MMGGKTFTVPIPDIRLENIDLALQGVTAAELTSVVMKQLVPAVVKAAEQGIADVSKQATEALKGSTAITTNLLNKTSGVGNLFKKLKQQFRSLLLRATPLSGLSRTFPLAHPQRIPDPVSPRLPVEPHGCRRRGAGARRGRWQSRRRRPV